MLHSDLATLLSILLPARDNPPSRRTDSQRLRLPAYTLGDVNSDVFRLLALQLDQIALQNLALCSRKLRELASPLLFACCKVFTQYADDSDPPPQAIKQYVQRLVHYGRLDRPHHVDYFTKIIDCFPALSSVAFDSSQSGVSWFILKVCFARPRITSIAFGQDADFLQTVPFPEDEVASTCVGITDFSYVMPPFRRVRHAQLRRRLQLKKSYSRETACLLTIMLKMHESAVRLALPLETAPLQAMADTSWPRLRELALQGDYVDTAHTLTIPAFLQSLPHLRKLSILGHRPTGVPRAPTLGRRLSHAPRSARNGLPAASPITAFEDLRSLTIADPDPEDDIFSVHMPSLTHLSLRDWRRHYFHLRWCDGDRALPQRAILTSAECLSVLKRMTLPRLTSLEIVYIADEADDELISYISSNFQTLQQLEIHRYRQDRRTTDSYAHIARLLLPLRSLQVIRLNLDLEGDHGPHCGDYDVRGAWHPIFKDRGWELVEILQACPQLEFVGLLYHGTPNAIWVEFHPSRCAEPRYVEEYTQRTIDSQPSSRSWMYKDPLPY